MSAEGLQQLPALQTPMHMVKYLNMHSNTTPTKNPRGNQLKLKAAAEGKKILIQFTMKSTIKKFF